MKHYNFVILGGQSSLGRNTALYLSMRNIPFLVFKSKKDATSLSYQDFDPRFFLDSIIIDFRGLSDIEKCERDNNLCEQKNYSQSIDFFCRYEEFFFRYIYISSASVDGLGDGVPVSAYARSKKKLEESLAFRDKAVGVRLHSTYGQFQRKMFVYECAKSLIVDGKFVSKSPLVGSRDLIHQDSVGFWLLSQDFNSCSSLVEIVSGFQLSLKDIAEIIRTKAGFGEVVSGGDLFKLNPIDFRYSSAADLIMLPQFKFPYQLETIFNHWTKTKF